MQEFNVWPEDRTAAAVPVVVASEGIGCGRPRACVGTQNWDVVPGTLCRNAGTGTVPSGICPHCTVGRPRALLSVGRFGGR